MSLLNKPKLTVVMPAYNVEEFVGLAIESVLSQSFKDFEFVIVDDCSEDLTAEIIKSYAEKDSRIKFLQNKTNRGISYTRSLGVKSATGEFIANMDADDLMAPGRLEMQLGFLESNPAIEICFGDMELIDSKGVSLNRFRYFPINDLDIKRAVFKYDPFPNATMMYRSYIHDTVGYYEESYKRVEDFDFWVRVGTQYRFHNLGVILHYWRMHKSSSNIIRTNLLHGTIIEIQNNALLRYGYRPDVLGIVYFLSHKVVFYVIPEGFKYKIFNFLRTRGW